jgi:hypothetical protein
MSASTRVTVVALALVAGTALLLIVFAWAPVDPAPVPPNTDVHAGATTGEPGAVGVAAWPQTGLPERVSAAAASVAPGAIAAGCENVLEDVPLSDLERELRRLLAITLEVLAEKGLTGWAADGTLLGMARNGRVATDRDLDFQIESSYRWCENHLLSLREAFERRTTVRMFKVVYGRWHGIKIGRYAMVRTQPAFGTFGTGVDFNCVYGDEKPHTMHVHRGTIEPIPDVAYPLGFCLAYGMPVRCPRDPMAVLGMFAPRYSGCMVFPHCTGDPAFGGHKRCLAPHPPLPRPRFVEAMRKLESCGWVSLAKHFAEEPLCAQMLAAGDSGNKCQAVAGARWPMCFLQSYNG